MKSVLESAISAVDPAKTTVPVSGEYHVGAYLFPGWETRRQWGPISVHPCLGTYDQSKRAVAEWQIKWACEHGIKFFAFDWYWRLGEEKLNSALDAFLQARNALTMKFCLHACNEAYFKVAPHGRCGSYFDWGLEWNLDSPQDFIHDLSQDDFNRQFSHVAERYFSHPSYLFLEGRPVFIQYRTNLIMRAFGIQGTRAIVDQVRRLLKDMGFDLYLVAGGSCIHDDYIAQCKAAGFNAVTGYNYIWTKAKIQEHMGKKVMRGSYDDAIIGSEETWRRLQRICDAQGIDFIPPLCPGFDNSPWDGSVVITGNTPAKFKQMCERAKPYTRSRHRMLLIEAWNEWGEGSAIEPSKEWGFEYLDVVREVFNGTGGSSNHEVPTDVSGLAVTD